MGFFSKGHGIHRIPIVQPPPSYEIFPELLQNTEADACPSIPREVQIIEDRYIDDGKLLEYCKQRFGIGNYRLKVDRTCTSTLEIVHGLIETQHKFNRYYLLVPEILDEVRAAPTTPSFVPHCPSATSNVC